MVRENEGPIQLGMAKRALAASGLSHLTEREVASVSLVEAHARVVDLFQLLKVRGKAPGYLSSPRALAASLLGENLKLSKSALTPASPVSETANVRIVGLNLLPADKLFTEYPTEYPTSPLLPILKNSGPFGMRTLCAGSNAMCRGSCLVFTGNNAVIPYNDHRKAVVTTALLRDPVAFVRLLVEAIRIHVDISRRAGKGLLIRLNMLSDIPWELFTPWLFTTFSDVRFYDYTKVGDRTPPINYDLTYSYSGTNTNMAKRELYRNNRRVAMVFLGMRKKNGQWVAFQSGTRFPAMFDLWGEPRRIVNADVNDARPLDPPNPLDDLACIAGLRWKTPMGQNINPNKDYAFVTPAYLLTRDDGVQLQHPDEEGLIVAPVTPRAQQAEGMET